MLGGRVDGLLVVACALERLEGVGEGRCASRLAVVEKARPVPPPPPGRAQCPERAQSAA